MNIKEYYRSICSWMRKPIFPSTSLVTPLSTSIARDCLQTERSLLQYCKFAATLSFVSLAALFDYRFNSHVSFEKNISAHSRKYAMWLGIVFFLLSTLSLIVGIFTYYNSIYHYINQRKRTGCRWPTQYYLTITVLTLLAINIFLLVDAYHEP